MVEREKFMVTELSRRGECSPPSGWRINIVSRFCAAQTMQRATAPNTAHGRKDHGEEAGYTWHRGAVVPFISFSVSGCTGIRSIGSAGAPHPCRNNLSANASSRVVIDDAVAWRKAPSFRRVGQASQQRIFPASAENNPQYVALSTLTCAPFYSGVGSASLAIQLTLDTLASMLMRLAINSSFD
jgi:hypothetical protein